MPNVLKDLSGMRFGELTVLKRGEDYISKKGRRSPRWICLCSCGNKKLVHGNSLRRGDTRSCGCKIKEITSKKNKKYNTYDLSGKYGIGYTSKGEEFYFDLEDYDKIKNLCWNIHDGYVEAPNSLKMHRFVMSAKRNEQIDHIYHNTNDNRKSQLRVVDRSKNGMNRILNSNNTSGTKGVSYNKAFGKWTAYIQVYNDMKYLGSYLNKEDAIKVRKEAEEKYFGEYAFKRSGCALFDKQEEK